METSPLRVPLSLDLNLTTVEVEVTGGCFRHGGHVVPLSSLEILARAPRKVFCLSAWELSRGVPARELAWEPLEIFSGHHYQLVPTEEAPTVEIDGVQMHRTSGVGPFHSARLAAEAVVRPGDRVLDTCGGLGYTAIQAARLGASEVLSTEMDDGVLQLRRRNPWSRLESGCRIRLVEEDVFAHLAKIPPAAFDSVIHDPPRYSVAPDLYSEPFYLRLRELLGSGGRLFH